MCSDPRNDRPSESDRDSAINYDAVTCGICDRPLTPATFAAWDAHDTCTVVSEAEFGVDTADDVPEDAECHRPMTTGEAMAMAVDAICEGHTLLNGRAFEDDEEEDTTTEVDALPDGRPCSVAGCGRVVGDCPHWAPSYAVARRTEAA